MATITQLRDPTDLIDKGVILEALLKKALLGAYILNEVSSW
jgi:hypothetical protein